jgi:hypothetical protein
MEIGLPAQISKIAKSNHGELIIFCMKLIHQVAVKA